MRGYNKLYAIFGVMVITWYVSLALRGVVFFGTDNLHTDPTATGCSGGGGWVYIPTGSGYGGGK